MRNREGRRIVLTRSAEDCADWAQRLETLGFTPVILPCIVCEMFCDPALGRTLATEARTADWLVFTSRRGVEAFASLHDAPLRPGTKVAAVGQATAAAARTLLGRIDLTGRGGTAAALADDIQFALAQRRLGSGATVRGDANQALRSSLLPNQALRGSLLPKPEAAGPEGVTSRSPARRIPERLLLVLAENAAGTLEDKLRRAGIARNRVNVYRTTPIPPTGEKTALSSLAADAIFLASPTAVEGFVNRVDIDVAPMLITIGPSTSAAVRAQGLDVAAEARAPGLEGLLEAMQCLS